MTVPPASEPAVDLPPAPAPEEPAVDLPSVAAVEARDLPPAPAPEEPALDLPPPVFAPEPPPEVDPPPLALGRLGAALRRLAAAQGTWPPAELGHVVRAPWTSGLREGAQAADRLVDSGVDLVLVDGDIDATPALTLLAALLDLEPTAAVGTASTAGWAARVAAVRDGLKAARPHVYDMPSLLRAVGAEEVAGLAGVLAQCAVRRTPVLLSAAPAALAAAVVAERIAPGTTAWLTAGTTGGPGAAERALAYLRLDPLLDLRLSLPTGADLALGVLVDGIALARDLAGPVVVVDGQPDAGPGPSGTSSDLGPTPGDTDGMPGVEHDGG